MSTKKVYEVLHPIAWGGRLERGETVEMTDEEASAFAPGMLKSAGTVAPKADEEVVAVADMNLTQLRAKAKELELDASGSKADLIERITLATGDTTSKEDADGEGEGDDE